jgi:two-component system, OmpR family, response regulator
MTPTRILVVEEDPTLRSSLTTYLVDVGFDTWATNSAEEALQIMAKKRLDIVIIDLQVPRVDGGCIVRKGRAMQPALKFLVQTTQAEDFRIPKCLVNLGVTREDVLHKPIRDPEVVLQSIRRLTAGCVPV